MNAAEILIAAGFIGLGAFILLRRQAPAQPASAPAGAGAIPSSLQGVISTALLNPNALNHAIFGVGTDTFKTVAQMSDFDAASHAMCSCYHGSQEGCIEARFMIPGLRTCKPGDCDCHPSYNGATGVVTYRDSHGGPYTAPLVRTKEEMLADARRRGVS